MSKEISVEEDGYVTGADVEKVKSRLFFPESDALQYLSNALFKQVMQSIISGEPIASREPSGRVIMVTVPLWDELIKELEDLEVERLEAHGEEACIQCKAETQTRCPGTLVKGDLVQNIVGTALRIGILAMLELVSATIENGLCANANPTSAAQVFNPIVDAITDRRRS